MSTSTSTRNGTFARWFLYTRERDSRPPPEPTGPDYDRMSEVELRARARVDGIRGFAGLGRPELIAALRER